VQVTLAEDTAENSRSLLDVSVNAVWDETAASLEAMDAITDDARVVSDAEDRPVTANLLRAIRLVRYSLEVHVAGK
jgi:hypothetical protein